MPAVRQGRCPFRSWTLWYGVIGDVAARAPLIFVPGGPGSSHHFFEPIARLAPPGRPLVYYDPSGAGASDRPTGVDWNLDLLVDELAALQRELRLERFHLFGSSFGGTVCLAYALRRPVGLLSMVLSGTTASYPALRAIVHGHIACLPSEQRAMFTDPDVPPWGTPFPVAYAKLLQGYASRYLCRVPFPKAMAESMAVTNYEAMNRMKGKGFTYDGTLREVDFTDRLPEIDVPALVACGRYDPLYPDIYQSLHRGLRRSRLVVFPNSSHMPQFEEERSFANALFGFADEHEGSPPPTGSV
jgi:proline-specific peptidase